MALVAGETSGDLLAGLLLDGFCARWPGLTAVGIGGPQMARRGFSPWWPSEKLAVRGYVEVLRHYREIVGIRKQLRERLLQLRPDVFIGVDAPDFNLDLEADLKAAGIRTVHFISPSVWAWRADRVEKIRRSVDHVLCIFPFEPALLAQHGIAATYVGHPLAGMIPMQPDKAAARQQLGLAADDLVLAVLPGSRRSEIKYLADRFFRAAALVQQAQPAIKIVVPAVPALRQQIEQAAQDAGVLAKVQIVAGQSHTVLAACDVTLIASGTATLEAALFKRPMVIAYNMNWLSWQIMRRKKLQPWVGLPNILCRDFVVPELLQDAATPQALAAAVLQWIDAKISAPEKIAAVEQRFTQLHHELQRDTAQLATDAIQNILEG
ncbi:MULTISPECIES: lipid-A-disaccharide synthase [unclassified Polaromonas]|jgi:lipid-A-disaccharide synthase|uniref:lipid-A-disaccharide synthase n=1 Tax=unclassified Polaromonas TaxID=2638319 RepID=UPI000BCB6B61|nr:MULTISPECIES: lipid-A-disaccharide synthase [unclassified Polaromonas]OYY39088.1 MAG: lipid-A-disaccharide synthase [Polaromonas sp. 35-63-35]OYZ21953.1 MAG: lipid-A-disaccharide synthase [Polaromonas sp. 16-63-31]OYZ80390.1 MAG: lipid-A-disaccharide synthase [Polaromonas sp. 24-63-21]OZA51454.1 MAG: lipid-A-disaccharide synthase [Polaromonas sp. 17-63-33]OZA90076.1 MAG: lipid-A-disaccharide synthase [Polaromonas sp. 39-63-25]